MSSTWHELAQSGGPMLLYCCGGCESLKFVTDRRDGSSNGDALGIAGVRTRIHGASRTNSLDTPKSQAYDPLGLHPGGPEPVYTGPAANLRRLTRLLGSYGWRAYVLPVLTVVTVLVLVDAVKGGGEPPIAAVPGVGRPSSTKAGGVIGAPPIGDGVFAAGLPTGALPDGGPFTEAGAGHWHIVRGTSVPVGAGQGHRFTYTVEIEDGVDTSGFGGDDAVAQMIDATLANPKSWTHDREFGFRRTDSGAPDFRVSLTSRKTTETACGFEIPIDSSCFNADLGRVVLSEVRWVRGAVAFEGDIGSYRQYQINHEVGHAIGYHQHQPCETDGGLAPVMMQQTFGTRNDDIAALDPEGVVPKDGKECRFNPWPYPRG